MPNGLNDKSERKTSDGDAAIIQNKEHFRENVVPFLAMLTIDFNFESSLCFRSSYPPPPASEISEILMWRT